MIAAITQFTGSWLQLIAVESVSDEQQNVSCENIN